MSKIYLIVISIILSASINIKAQDVLNADSVDKKMEEMFDKSDWRGMISYGENALRKGFEFFFLRARLGIAYYKTKNYFKAIPNFEKALEIGYENPTVMEYLYYSYLNTGRDDDKNFIFKQLPKRMQKRIKPLENLLVDNLHSEFGTGISNDNDKNGALHPEEFSDYYGEQTLNGNETYFIAGLNQLPLSFLNVNYIYTYLNTEKTNVVEYNFWEDHINEYSEIQNRFYNSFNIRAATGFIFSPAAQYLSTQSNSYQTVYDSTVISGQDSGKKFFTITEQDDSYNSFVLSMDISKYVSIFKFGVNGSFSYLNKIHQSQYGLSFKVFPFSKTNFYSYTNLNLQYQNSVANMIVDQSFTGNFKYKFIYEAFVTVGKMRNYNEHNGYRVYNNSDLISYKFGLDLKYYLTDHFRANFIYSFQNRQRNYQTYYPNNSFTEDELEYQVNNFLIGLNYDF